MKYSSEIGGGNIAQSPIDVLNDKIDKLNIKVSEGEKKFEEKIKEEGKVFDEKMKEREIRTTEILAIFITLFTFISVNVSIFTRVEDVPTAICFMLLMTLCSIIILSFLFILLDSKRDWKVWVGLIVSLIFIVFLILMIFSKKWDIKLNNLNTILVPIDKVDKDK